MSTPVLEEPQALARARDAAQAAGLSFAGSIAPREAWALVQAGQAVLVDVRSAEERHFVGHVPGSLHVAWATGTSLNRNPRFAKELEAKVGARSGNELPVLLLCRSGKRSALAAEAAAKAGLTAVFNPCAWSTAMSLAHLSVQFPNLRQSTSEPSHRPTWILIGLFFGNVR